MKNGPADIVLRLTALLSSENSMLWLLSNLSLLEIRDCFWGVVFACVMLGTNKCVKDNLSEI